MITLKNTLDKNSKLRNFRIFNRKGASSKNSKDKSFSTTLDQRSTMKSS